MGALHVPKISVEEYLAADRVAEVPSEYHDGEMFPIGNDSTRHAVIVANATGILYQRLKSSACVVMAPTRVRVSPTRFVYPDILIVCGQPELTDESQDTLKNPKVIFEILSPSTSDYDYGKKFEYYRLLASFEEYVLIAQDRARVEVFRRTPTTWNLSTYEGLDSVVPLETLSIQLPLLEIYDKISFTN